MSTVVLPCEVATLAFVTVTFYYGFLTISSKNLFQRCLNGRIKFGSSFCTYSYFKRRIDSGEQLNLIYPTETCF